ncbi:NAD(P)-dependent alcohol dehydrogenase [Rhodobacteraceae bacterium DSL-40]|uniref:NAD(P)-dependent alcohol dehydrogenase n=1 Tax=Amaricoccus sp. B4 TaxID=3368557 RepID=UPI000DAC70FF
MTVVPETMKAAVVTAWGAPDLVRIEERPVPRPTKDEVLIRVVATTVSAADVRMRGLDVPRGMKLPMRLALGFSRPRQPVFGTEAAGIVAACGPQATRFAPGDAVIAFPGARLGAHAEYLAISERRPLTAKPARLSFEEAAGLCFGGTTALHFLRKAELAAGERVLVIGASGAVGAALVQLAKHAGAEVTAVSSARNLALTRDLGADHALDYAETDPLAAAAAYDVIADAAGATSFAACLDTLRPGGRYLAIAGGLGEMLTRPRGGKRIIAGMAAERPEDVATLARIAEEGAFRVVIDRVLPLEQIAEAHRIAGSHRKRGNLVLAVSAPG